jgi:hypothetical protein
MKGLSLISKQGIRQDYVIQKQEYEMCKTNVKMNIYYANICRHKYEKNMTRLWWKIMPKIGVEHTKGKNKILFLFIPL